MDPAAILSALSKIGYFANILNHTEEWINKRYSNIAHYNNITAHYNATYGALNTADMNSSMYLIFALRLVSRAIAVKRLRDPMQQPAFTKIMLEVYAGELTWALSGSGGPPSWLDMTLVRAVASEEAIGLFLKDKLKLEGAAQRIVSAAERVLANFSSNKNARLAMYQMMKMCFEVESTVYSLGDVAHGQYEKPSANYMFDIGETYGETSAAYFQKLFVLEDGKAKWEPDSPVGFVLKPEMAAKLKLLRKALTKGSLPQASQGYAEDASDADLAEAERVLLDGMAGQNGARASRISCPYLWQKVLQPPGFNSNGLSSNQYNYLQELARRLNRKQYLTLFMKVSRAFADRYNVPLARAEELARSCISYLETRCPITITFPEEPFKGAGGAAMSNVTAWKNTFQISRREKDVSELLGGKRSGSKLRVQGPDADLYGQDRGGEYLIWRKDKDDRTTNLRGLLPDEMPLFGAVNQGFDHTQGAGNYYGKCHFVLKPEIRNRSAYTLDTRFQTRWYMLEIINDMFEDQTVVGSLDNIVGLASNLNIGLADLFFEIHIYGDLNLRRDVAYIVVGDTVDESAKVNIRSLAANNGLAIRMWNQTMKARDIWNIRTENLIGMIDQMNAPPVQAAPHQNTRSLIDRLFGRFRPGADD